MDYSLELKCVLFRKLICKCWDSSLILKRIRGRCHLLFWSHNFTNLVSVRIRGRRKFLECVRCNWWSDTMSFGMKTIEYVLLMTTLRSIRSADLYCVNNIMAIMSNLNYTKHRFIEQSEQFLGFLVLCFILSFPV